MDYSRLKQPIDDWIGQQNKMLEKTSANNPWWSFVHDRPITLPTAFECFNKSQHRFGPMIGVSHARGTTRHWFPLDKCLIKQLYQHLKPTFAHIISKRCHHLSGPNAVRVMVRLTNRVLNTKRFNHFCRLDIKSYYASIDHPTLVKQVKQTFDDPMILQYLPAIITVAIDKDGILSLPTKGIPRGSSLSPLFGALYLSELDRALENKPGVFYLRFQDDIIILTETKRQLRNGRRIVSRILKKLKLSLSPHKSCYGDLAKKSFHYLGVTFSAKRTAEKPSRTQERVSLHSRSCLKALDKTLALAANAVHPATLQRYLIRWAAWWRLPYDLSKQDNLDAFWHYVKEYRPRYQEEIAAILWPEGGRPCLPPR